MRFRQRLFGTFAAGLAAAMAMPAGHALAETGAKTDGATVGAPVDPSALSIAREIIARGYPEESRAELFGSAIDTLAAQFDELPIPGLEKEPELQAMVERHLQSVQGDLNGLLQRHLPVLMDALTVAYAREFSIAELHDIRAFVSTPTGARFFSQSARLVADPDIAAANQAMMAEAMAISVPMREALEKDLLAYFTENPEAALRITERN